VWLDSRHGGQGQWDEGESHTDRHDQQWQHDVPYPLWIVRRVSSSSPMTAQRATSNGIRMPIRLITVKRGGREDDAERHGRSHAVLMALNQHVLQELGEEKNIENMAVPMQSIMA